MARFEMDAFRRAGGCVWDKQVEPSFIHKENILGSLPNDKAKNIVHDGYE
jgi:hypothetical protein